MKLVLTGYILKGSPNTPETVEATFTSSGTGKELMDYMLEHECLELDRDFVGDGNNTALEYIFVKRYNITEEVPKPSYHNLGSPGGFIAPGWTRVTMEVSGWPVKSKVEALAKGYFGRIK